MGGPPEWCSICRHGATRKPHRAYLADSHAYPARFDGQCPACNLPIHVGAPIVHTTAGVFVHDTCKDHR